MYPSAACEVPETRLERQSWLRTPHRTTRESSVQPVRSKTRHVPPRFGVHPVWGGDLEKFVPHYITSSTEWRAFGAGTTKEFKTKLAARGTGHLPVRIPKGWQYKKEEVDPQISQISQF